MQGNEINFTRLLISVFSIQLMNAHQSNICETESKIVI